MDRTLFTEEHNAFRKAFRSFVDREITPHQQRWRDQGQVDREVWRKAGAQGFLCTWMDDKYGGPGGDFLYAMIVMEELANAYESGLAMALHSDIIVPYIYTFGTEEQKQKWLPGCASGEIVTALGMTEPGTGSDVAGISTTAVKDGDDYVINGAKTFISNGQLCDLCVVAAKTDADPKNAHRGISMFVVEANRKGFTKGKRLHKMGMASQDTSELFFEDCRIPASNRIGEEGAGFMMMMQKLQQERLCVAIGAVTGAERVLEDTIAYTKERKAFGKPISKFQNTQFKLVECLAKVQVGRAYVDKVVQEHVAGKYLVTECSIAKFWTTDMAQEVIDDCLQFFGGYGYMLEYPVTRAFMDARVQRIYAGTNEIMKVIVAKQMGL
ncbi:MAG: acyl-CoA dehydrogenase family protein [Myxococcota bacterium]|nr:acyl-CoA dehydrogenase family protein [Deltaproteobacteria bacterium]MDQ3339670.1 acyl-CoA dehydrogenase family protein [Myxococcota bacterium]